MAFLNSINIPWKISEPIIVIPNAKKIDEDWILVIIFVIGTALILAFLIYFLLYLFKNYKNQPQGPPMTRLINSFRTVSGARPSWLKRSNDLGGTRSSALKSYSDTTGKIHYLFCLREYTLTNLSKHLSLDVQFKIQICFFVAPS